MSIVEGLTVGIVTNTVIGLAKWFYAHRTHKRQNDKLDYLIGLLEQRG